MSDTPQAGPAPRPTPQSERRTVSRAAGLFVGAGTALVVFAAGSLLWPVRPPPAAITTAPPSPVPLVPPPPPPPRATPTDSGTTVDSGSSENPNVAAEVSTDARSALAPRDGGRTTAGSADGADADDAAQDDRVPSDRRAGKKHRRDAAAGPNAPWADANPDAAAPHGDGGDRSKKKKENAPLPPSDGTAPEAATDPGREGSAECDLPEKDIARGAWRRNWPAICPLAPSDKAFILIPLKGSVDGETHAVSRRPAREARITLPLGCGSLLTLKQYKVRRLGFKELRVNAMEDGRTRLRIRLQPGAGDPIFEVKDGYAKITVAAPH